MRFVASLFLTAALLAATTVAFAANPLVQNLQDISVTIKSGEGQGSGVIFTRKVGNENVSYVWTAAHVIDNLRSVRTVVVNGSPRQVIEFKDAQIVQEFRQDGRRIGEIKMEARVVRYSDAELGEDLAVLEVRKRNFTSVTTTFYKDAAIPPIGTELYHVGSLKGQFGANSLTEGIVSQHGRVLNLGNHDVVFDQTTVTAFPGSSGGGVFLKSNGQYMGMLVRGADNQFNFIVPIRRLREWAQAAKVEWAIDPAINMPSADELKKLPIEDAGVSFLPLLDAAAAKPKTKSSPNEPVASPYKFFLEPSPASKLIFPPQ